MKKIVFTTLQCLFFINVFAQIQVITDGSLKVNTNAILHMTDVGTREELLISISTPMYLPKGSCWSKTWVKVPASIVTGIMPLYTAPAITTDFSGFTMKTEWSKNGI